MKGEKRRRREGKKKAKGVEEKSLLTMGWFGVSRSVLKLCLVQPHY